MDDVLRRGLNQKGFGACILLVSPEGAQTSVAIKLDFNVTNNVAQYEAYIIRLHATIEIR